MKDKKNISQSTIHYQNEAMIGKQIKNQSLSTMIIKFHHQLTNLLQINKKSTPTSNKIALLHIDNKRHD